MVTVISIFGVAFSTVFNHRRFGPGLYAGHVYGLVASSLVLVALITEHVRLYAILAEALSSESTAYAGALKKTQQPNAANEYFEQCVKGRTV